MKVGDKITLQKRGSLFSKTTIVIHSKDHVHIISGNVSLSCDPKNISCSSTGLKAADPDLEHVQAKIRMPKHIARWVAVQLSHVEDGPIVDGHTQKWHL